MANTSDVVVSGSSIIKNPLFNGKNEGSTYTATASPDKVDESDFVFGKDAVVVFKFSNLTTTADTQNGYRAYDDEIGGNSRLIEIVVYENAEDYLAIPKVVAYRYEPQNPDGTNLSNS